MDQYCGLLQQILNVGHQKADRTGTGTLSFFGAQLRFDLQDGFPMVTTKKLHLRSIIHELLWFLNGDTNIQYLKDNNVSIWDEWAVPEDEYEELELTGPERVDYAVEHKLWTGGRTSLRAFLNGEQVEDGHRFLTKMGVPTHRKHLVRKAGDLGPVYGKQWRDWVGTDGRHHDQITAVINQLRNDPDNRRIIVSAWNVGELDQMALAPCHSFFQFYTRVMDFEERESWFFDNHDQTQFNNFIAELNGRNLDRDAYEGERYQYIVENTPERMLSCQLYQRSADMFLGVPFNIASYALLIHMVAQQVNMVPGEFIWTGGDVHIYSNHMEQVKEQLTRNPLPLPKLVIKRKPDSIFDYKFEDFEIQNYQSHPAIKAPVAI